ncbi:RNA-directed DNA polymerase (Reverse transcriptase), Ribonuclease H-like protein [Gossypium australe]|uniref:RNA-directed DNA polymerase n=1 Tax=Gossypium australe TaxID=47621 RepID=A0A5B6UVH4_9ROSI|nr:RNA-directed DNA polymerase (Reverse transcriptase), Ribonuclease H-like protein [Gossypium australe]
MEKRPSESFRQYAQRWRELATQVQPPLSESEASTLFIHTLKAPFISYLLGSSTKDFAEVVRCGEMIEHAIRCGKIEAGEGSRKAVMKKRESDVNNVSIRDKPTTRGQPSTIIANRPGSHKQELSTKPNMERLQFTPIYTTYGKLYQKLYDTHVVAPHYLQPLQPPYLKWYNANAQCEYHAGIVGYSIENCLAFKRLVEKLIQMGVVKVDDEEHPLLDHANNGVNMMGENIRKRIKTNVAEIKTPLRWVWKQWVNNGLIMQESREELKEAGRYCEFHAERDHDIQECPKFRAIVQHLMDNKEMEFYEEEGPSRKVYGGNYPAVIISRPKAGGAGTPIIPKVIIQKPVALPYRDNKRVPWSYECKVIIPGKGNPVNAVEENRDEGFFTRSGRRYTPNTRAEVAKGKAVASEQREERTIEPGAFINEPVTESEAREFLKFLKHSEFSVLKQLHKQSARISILDLLKNSETYRNALMKVLNETYVAGDISVNKLDRLVGNISADNFIFFNDDEIPSGGMGSTKVLHITTRCKGYTLPGVLVDNGSALNVLPLSMLNRLPVDSSHMKTCHNIVRAFDGTERRVMGRIDIPLQIGPNTYEVDFLVMDIKPSYNCLLGRPWIHSAGAVPSSLHQKLKLVTEGRLVTINAEEDIIASVTSGTPYIEVDEEAIECSFRSLEFINAIFIAEGSKIPVPKISKSTRMGLQMTIGKGALPGKGLGRNLQGKMEPDAKQRRREEEKRRERRRARLGEEEIKWEPMTFPPLSKIFVSGGILYPDRGMTAREETEEMLGNLSINAISEERAEERTLFGIRPCAPGSVLSNWTVEEIPVAFRSNSESPDINGMSDTAIDSESPFERDTGMEDSQDFEDDQDRDVSLDLLRMVEQGEKKILPHEETVEMVNLGEGKELKIETSITAKTKQDLIELLKEFRDVFAWSYQDMPGLNTEIVVHRLPIKVECKPVQQKLRRIRPDVLLKIKEEVSKQFDAGFLQVVKYSEWVANIVPVPKKDGKVRMCVDYRDLNKASPKDNFPLPHIDTLVDNTTGYSLFSFMDGFSGYNQIKMHPEDMEKTTFVTMWGTFCYKVMPFGLKNAGATYQRAMVTLFHDMMHKEIEVYVDDMIAKSRTEKEHVQVLRKLFLRLRKFQLKLNPTKCTFGARSGKLLGFVVSQKGIEVDPDKVKAIRELPPPRTQKEVRGFLGRLNYIARFIVQLTEKCDPIFRLLRKHNPGVWNDECQKAFDKVKHYLSKAPVLVPPCPNKPLILYLSVFENSMGCVLGQHDESGRKERAIYYLSKKFTECETRYSPIEKLCCALVWTTRRLRQYMLYHTTWLISKLDPLKFVMESTALNGRIARWQILLSEFDIVYVNQKAIKESAIADFLASRALEDYEPLDFNFPNEDLMYVAATEEEGHPWKLNFDGASNAVGNGIGAVLVSPNGDHYPLTSKLDFDCTNNMAEYEACILGIRAAIERKIGTLEVYGDSALVIYQLKGEWETRDPKLISYRRLVLELIKEFDNITFCYLPREENQMADALATLASMIKINKEGEDRGYPDQATENDKRTLRRLANDYDLDGEILYKKRKDQVLLRCVDAIEAKKILEEVHEGVCGTHANGFTMARQIMRFGYYWSTMEGDCISYAKKCHKCQIYGDKIHVPPSPLHVMTSP